MTRAGGTGRTIGVRAAAPGGVRSGAGLYVGCAAAASDPPKSPGADTDACATARTTIRVAPAPAL